MNVTRTCGLMALRAVTAAVAAFALGVVAIAPAANAEPAAPLEPPYLMTIASSPITGGQTCDESPLSRTRTPIISARTLADDHTDLRLVVQVAQPGHLPLTTGKAAFSRDRQAAYQVPDGVIQDGVYTTRARIEDGSGASEWTPWCDFTVYTGDDVDQPGTPTSLRASSGPYRPFQYCWSSAGDPVLDTRNPQILVADSSPSNPNVVGRYELDRPGADPLVELAPLFANGWWVPLGTLSVGKYRFRVRAEDGAAVSEWSAWCDFSVQ